MPHHTPHHKPASPKMTLKAPEPEPIVPPPPRPMSPHPSVRGGGSSHRHLRHLSLSSDVFSIPKSTMPIAAKSTPSVFESTPTLDEPPRLLQNRIPRPVRAMADIETLTTRTYAGTKRTKRSIRRAPMNMWPNPNPKPKETEIETFHDEVTGVGHSSLLSLFSLRMEMEREKGMETASVPPPTPTQTRRKGPGSFELAPGTSCSLSPPKDEEIPSMPSTPVKGDMAIALKKKERERQAEGDRR
ncbi:hypothetical protein V5O48_012349 [Marasmius crinis-equi]|uniref:Uncharacterized protein n=1 Tax=Marasmius crinis-equi TaxID=585013 RepID=A0ABR3F330_9AGAR